MEDTTTLDDPAIETTVVDTPAVVEDFDSMWDASFDENGNPVGEAETPADDSTDRARNEDGTFAAVETPAETETPAAEAPKEEPAPVVEFAPQYTIKEDGVEKTLDLTKEDAEAVKTWLEKGRNFDTVLERRTSAAATEGAAALIKEIRAAGYGIATVTDPYTGAKKIQIQLPQGQATPEGSETPTPTPSLATLDGELTALEEKIAAGKGKAPDFAMLSKLNRQRSELMFNERTSEQQQRTLAARQQIEREGAVKQFAAKINGLIDTHTAAVTKLTGMSKVELMKDAWRYAVGTEKALGKDGTPDRVAQEVSEYLARKARSHTVPPAAAPVAAVATPAPAVTVGVGTNPGAQSDDPMRGAKTLEEVPDAFWDSFTF